MIATVTCWSARTAMGASISITNRTEQRPLNMSWLAYKVTLFYGFESASGIAYNETDALVAANKQVRNGAVLLGRRTERVAHDNTPGATKG